MKLYQNKDFLTEEYINNKKTASQIGRECGVSHRTILNWLKKYNIEINSTPQSHNLEQYKDEFIRLHYEENKTLKEIAKQYNISNTNLCGFFKRNSIKVIDFQKKKVPSKEVLTKLYCIEKNTMTEMAEQFETSVSTIKKWLLSYDIKLKSKKDFYVDNINSNNYPDYETLFDLYKNKKMCFKKIADEYNLAVTTIQRLIYHYEIDINAQYNKSSGETELLDYIKTIYKGKIETSNKSILNPYELDIYIPEKRIAFEFNGIFWHSDVHKDKMYHLNKTNMCLEQNIQLIHIFENQWEFKRDIVKSIIKNILGVTKDRVYARNLRIIEMNCRDFFIQNHIQGYTPKKIEYALVDDKDNIMCAMSFGKPRFNKKYEWELLRFCNKIDTCVVGGMSKLLQHFIKTHNPKNIITYCDRTRYQGGGYIKCGFEFVKNTEPNYFYTNDNFEIVSRYQTQKHKLKDLLPNFDQNLTEYENMKNSKYYKIWDCGNSVFVINL